MKVIPGARAGRRATSTRPTGRPCGSGRCRCGGRRAANPAHELFHPANDHYGSVPIEAAATAIDIHNEAAGWNKALLDNSARPSGALVYGRRWAATAEQFERLKTELETNFQGASTPGVRCCSKAGSTGSR